MKCHLEQQIDLHIENLFRRVSFLPDWTFSEPIIWWCGWKISKDWLEFRCLSLVSYLHISKIVSWLLDYQFIFISIYHPILTWHVLGRRPKSFCSSVFVAHVCWGIIFQEKLWALSARGCVRNYKWLIDQFPVPTTLEFRCTLVNFYWIE